MVGITRSKVIVFRRAFCAKFSFCSHARFCAGYWYFSHEHSDGITVPRRLFHQSLQGREDCEIVAALLAEICSCCPHLLLPRLAPLCTCPKAPLLASWLQSLVARGPESSERFGRLGTFPPGGKCPDGRRFHRTSQQDVQTRES